MKPCDVTQKAAGHHLLTERCGILGRVTGFRCRGRRQAGGGTAAPTATPASGATRGGRIIPKKGT